MMLASCSSPSAPFNLGNQRLEQQQQQQQQQQQHQQQHPSTAAPHTPSYVDSGGGGASSSAPPPLSGSAAAATNEVEEEQEDDGGGHHQQHHHHHHHLSEPEPEPVQISEARYHCVSAFERLRVLREQGRFCDLILSIQGRHFPAHRCVLASCSPWFDSKLKMHKTVKEEIKIDCSNLEIFYAVLTYFYTGQIAIDRTNVAELLHLSDYFSVARLRSHCCDYLLRNLHCKNVFSVLDLAVKFNLVDVLRQSVNFLQRNFDYLRGRPEILNLSVYSVNAFLSCEGLWSVMPQEILLTFIADWVGFHPTAREDSFLSILQFVNWNDVDVNFLVDHLEKHQLYQMNVDALYTILHVIHEKNIYLGSKYHEIYLSLQEKLLPPEQDLDELNDSNSFLSIAISSAVKDLEVDPVDWFLQNEPPPPNGDPYRVSLPESSQQTIQSSSTTPSSSSIVVALPQPSSSSYQSRQDRQDKMKDPLDFEIVEQVINEQRLSDEKSKYREAPSYVKRYDPKFRALTEVFRQETDDGNGRWGGYDGHAKYGHDSSADLKLMKPIDYDKFFKYDRQGQASASPFELADHSMSSLSTVEQQQQQQPMEVVISKMPGEVMTSFLNKQWSPESATDEEHGKDAYVSQQQQQQQLIGEFPAMNQENSDGNYMVPLAPPPSPPAPSSTSQQQQQLLLLRPSMASAVSTEEISRKLQEIETSIQMRSGQRMALDEEEEEAAVNESTKPAESVTKKQHLKKAKLLAEHNSMRAPSSCTNDESEKKQPKTASSSTSQRLLNCPQCAYSTISSHRMKVHSRHHEKELDFRCAFCPFSSRWQKETRSHVRQEHCPGPPFRCDQENCAYQSEKLHLLLTHRLTHAQHRDFSCPEGSCGFTTKTKNRLRIHILGHDKRFPCPLCQKMFPSRCSLEAHSVTHVADKQFSCEVCDFQTKYKSHLNLHVRLHAGTALTCDFDNCSYSTPKMSLLLAHKRAHRKEKIFVCGVCSRGFVENSQLARHKRTIHSDEMPFSCNRCKFRTKRKDKLKSHLERLHGVSEQQPTVVVAAAAAEKASLMLKYVIAAGSK